MIREKVLTGLSTERWHDLDALRAFALLLGVALHATMSFIEPRLWIIQDVKHATGYAVLFYIIHIFRLTTFFVVAGFFGRLLLVKRGLAGFITNRLARIFVPMIVFWPLVFFVIVAMAILANIQPSANHAKMATAPGFSLATFPLTHLWFLYLLLGFYVAAVFTSLVVKALHCGRFVGTLLDKTLALLVRSDVLVLALCIPTALAFYCDTKWLMWFGIMTPDTGFIPNPAALCAYTTAFSLGWWLQRQPHLIDIFAKRLWVYALGALAATALCLNIVGSTPSLTPVLGQDHLVYIGLYTIAIWSWAFALIGAARRFLTREIPAIRYISDASYWVYIVHLPILMVLQYVVMNRPWPAEAKYAFVLLLTMMIALLSYQAVVRYSFIGAILNGRRRRVRANTREVAV